MLDFSDSDQCIKGNIIYIYQKDLIDFMHDLYTIQPSIIDLLMFCVRLIVLNEQILQRTIVPPFYELKVEFPQDIGEIFRMMKAS